METFTPEWRNPKITRIDRVPAITIQTRRQRSGDGTVRINIIGQHPVLLTNVIRTCSQVFPSSCCLLCAFVRLTLLQAIGVINIDEVP
ncbi:hypothetical protein SCLCIDRAFT_1216438 [Scleroderma citrinum Foug A]|uniref:Uncharacterized protein n=1 Tax=Scleroderma citrinum Foug A TaxID=1036808 RepID=A0A0C3DYF4_9AGAM|nr:hypothetical protein SCLCIDRAFT_1216438 [Scleroderma citrinum Foug A]